MSKISKILLTIIIVVVTGLTLLVSKRSNGAKKEKINNKEIVKVEKGTLEKKQLFSGEFKFSKKIELKSKMNGILIKINKKIGDSVNINENIAEVKMVVDPVTFENARKQLKIAQINFKNQRTDYLRKEKLYNKGIISRVEKEGATKLFDLSREELNSARDNFFIAKNGFSSKTKTGKVNKIIATTRGIVIELPQQEGASIVKQGLYREGSTVAIIGNPNDLMFNFFVSENDIVNLQVGMPVSIYINALDKRVTSLIKKINYSSVKINNLPKYIIEAEINDTDVLGIIREGFTGTLELTLAKKEKVLLTKEKTLLFKNDSTFVKRITSKGHIEEVAVETGVSDGINIEIIGGLEEDDVLKVME